LECVSYGDRFSRVPGVYLVFGKFGRLLQDRDAKHESGRLPVVPVVNVPKVHSLSVVRTLS